MAEKKKAAAMTIVCQVERCLACHSCELACALVHSGSKDLRAAVEEDPKPRKRVTVEAAGDHALPLQCRHCENAPCVMICPTEAVRRKTDAGPVLIDSDRCIGCKLCMIVCPFGVVDLAPGGKAVIKCDQCAERVEAGELPACVAACATHALQFVDVEQYTRRKRKGAAQRIAAEAENTK